LGLGLDMSCHSRLSDDCKKKPEKTFANSSIDCRPGVKWTRIKAVHGVVAKRL